MTATVYHLSDYRTEHPAIPSQYDRAAHIASVAAALVDWDIDPSGFTHLPPSYRAELERAVAALRRVKDASVTLIRQASQ